MKLEHNETILFIGDSITDCGRERPVGMGAGLGEGYVAFADAMMATWYPQRRVRVFNTGINGNRVTDLAARWQPDVLNLAPDRLSVMIGINDVWRQFDNQQDPNQVSIDRYEAIYRKLLDQTRAGLKGLVLISPYFVEPNRSDPMREEMDAYGAVVKRLAKDFDAVHVDVQAAFDRYLAHRPSQSLCGDRVHPNKTGHLIIARAFLSAVQFDWGMSNKGA